jgi:flagellar biosynthesis/type III secretory pathway protein FliH
MDIVKILDRIKEVIEGHRWRIILFKTYPTKQSFSDAIEKRMGEQVQAIVLSSAEGFKRGHIEGYAQGYTEGFNEALKRAGEEFAEEFGKQLGEKRIRMVQ